MGLPILWLEGMTATFHSLKLEIEYTWKKKLRKWKNNLRRLGSAGLSVVTMWRRTEMRFFHQHYRNSRAHLPFIGCFTPSLSLSHSLSSSPSSPFSSPYHLWVNALILDRWVVSFLFLASYKKGQIEPHCGRYHPHPLLLINLSSLLFTGFRFLCWNSIGLAEGLSISYI